VVVVSEEKGSHSVFGSSMLNVGRVPQIETSLTVIGTGSILGD